MSTELLTPLTQVDDVDAEELARTANIIKVVDNLAGGMNITRACKVAGVNPRTWRRWKEKGLVQALLSDRFDDVMAGVRETVADSLVQSTKVLAQIAQGKMPKGTDFDGKLAPRDTVAAQQQLMRLWQAVADPEEARLALAEDALTQLRAKAVSVLTVNVQTMNIGTDQEPLPVPVGVLDVEHTVIDDGNP